MPDANYKVAWDMICKRFDNKRIIRYSHLNALDELPTLKDESRDGLRKLLDGMQRHLQSLDNLGKSASSRDTYLIFHMKKKLDSITKREWEKEIEGKGLPKLEKFVDFLTSKCRLLENMNYGNKFNKQSSRHCDRQERTYVHVTTNKLGPITQISKSDPNVVSCHLSIIEHRILNQLERFWELEEHEATPLLTNKERECEQHFINNFSFAARGVISIIINVITARLGNLEANSTLMVSTFLDPIFKTALVSENTADRAKTSTTNFLTNLIVKDLVVKQRNVQLEASVFNTEVNASSTV
ncbi:hypothetical protein ILUMI_17970 [Ignelater luminosus]|uniref:Uncharacterized protein n=1 Tax=Ignelater luminosus TaxID=2038154 RepID=A0A8K0CIX8_IGNLU|nr:hypothetical protein ILUMI_17970 [Ignelater luminosus]